jgi:hypothetical protein
MTFRRSSIRWYNIKMGIMEMDCEDPRHGKWLKIYSRADFGVKVVGLGPSAARILVV